MHPTSFLRCHATNRTGCLPGLPLPLLFFRVVFAFFLLISSNVEARTTPLSARDLLQLALEQLGGKSRLQSITQMQAKGLSTQNLLEQSERFEGPWLQNVFDFEEVCDFRAREHRVKMRVRGDQFPEWTKTEFSYGFREKLQRRGNPFLQTAQESAERLWQDPLKLLLLAQTAPDLRYGANTLQNQMSCEALLFTVGTTPCKISLSPFTHLPVSVETVSRRQDFWSVWGDVTTQTQYNNWQMLPGGWHYPFSWTVLRNGLSHKHITLTQVDIEVGPETGASVQEDFKGIQAAFESSKTPGLPVFRSQEIAEGITQFPGGFNTDVIELPKGLVVLEPINTSEFNEAFLRELEKRFPGKKVVAVIATDDAWPHSGGIRPYVARDIPVYALRENRTYLQKLVSAPHRLAPDAIQRKPRPLRLKAVSGKVTLGSGLNRMEIFPVRGAESERVIAVYFPERRLLYGSDLIQRMPDGKLYNPQITQELFQMVAREGLRVETVFAMHSGSLLWLKLQEGLTASLVLHGDQKEKE